MLFRTHSYLLRVAAVIAPWSACKLRWTYFNARPLPEQEFWSSLEATSALCRISRVTPFLRLLTICAYFLLQIWALSELRPACISLDESGSPWSENGQQYCQVEFADSRLGDFWRFLKVIRIQCVNRLIRHACGPCISLLSITNWSGLPNSRLLQLSSLNFWHLIFRLIWFEWWGALM